MKPILILKTGSTFKELAHEFGDFEDWIIAASGEAPGLFLVAGGVEEALPPLRQLAGIIVTGSHLMVSDGGSLVELWSQFLRDAVEQRVPVLGVCYGHQLLAQALGGRVANHPDGLELGMVNIDLEAAAQDDPLFSVLPAGFNAYVTHLQSVLELPPGAYIYGYSDFEPHHLIRYAPVAWGVQYHPEFTPQIMCAYIRRQRPRLQDDVEMNALIAQVGPLPESGHLLRRFCELSENYSACS